MEKHFKNSAYEEKSYAEKTLLATLVRIVVQQIILEVCHD